MKISERIYNLRKNMGLSQKDFAEKVGVSQSAINFWENGKREPRMNQLIQICQALNIELSELVDPVIPPAHSRDEHDANFKKYGYTKIDLPKPSEDFYKKSLAEQQGFVSALLLFFDPETVFAYYDVPFNDEDIKYICDITSVANNEAVDRDYIDKIREYARFIRSQKKKDNLEQE